MIRVFVIYIRHLLTGPRPGFDDKIDVHYTTQRNRKHDPSFTSVMKVRSKSKQDRVWWETGDGDGDDENESKGKQIFNLFNYLSSNAILVVLQKSLINAVGSLLSQLLSQLMQNEPNYMTLRDSLLNQIALLFVNRPIIYDLLRFSYCRWLNLKRHA